jgi:peptidyl-prolyl cis-trans isomerase SDCCAG10
MIPGFMIQGGDPTGTGMGGESIYTENNNKKFKDEFHQRLKFTKRGIVAMANASKNSNGSQFFITFGACEHLNKVHTIFGKVAGDTTYNVMALQSLDTA